MFILKRYNNQIISLLLFGFAFLNFYLFADRAYEIPNVFQARDLQRAKDLYFNFQWIGYGPELSGGGNLPGPFYYFLIGLPLFIFSNFKAVVLQNFILNSMAAVVFWNFLKKYSEPAVAYFFYFLFCCSYTLSFNSIEMWNPSFAVFFFAVGLVCLYQYADIVKFSLGVLFFGLAIQLHFAYLAPFLALLFYINFTGKLSVQEKLKRLLVLIILSVSLSAPYIYFRITTHTESDQHLTRGLTIYFTRIVKLFQNLIADRESLVADQILTLFKTDSILIISSFLLFFSKSNSSNLMNFFKFAIIGSIAPAAGFFIGDGFNRYLVPLVLSLLLYFALACGSRLNSSIKLFSVFITAIFAAAILSFFQLDNLNLHFSIIIALFALFFFGLAAVYFDKFLFRSKFLAILLILVPVFSISNLNKMNSVRNNVMTSGEATEIINFIVENTNWNQKNFRSRTIISELHSELDLEYLYSQIYEARSDLGPQNLKLAAYIKDETVALPEKFNCIFEKKITRFSVCLYETHLESEEYSKGNIINLYLNKQPALFKVEQELGINIISDRHAVIYINKCAPAFDVNCTIYFIFNLSGPDELSVNVLGDPLAASHPLINPVWTIALISPKVKVFCNSRETEFELVSRIGFEDNRKTVLAPFRTNFHLPCRDPKKIELLTEKYESVYKPFRPTRIEWNR